MANLRNTLKQATGPDKFGNEVTLTETDIQPYIDNPEIAQMEADVTKARYGGSSIQDKTTDTGGTVQQTAAGGQRPGIDFSRRGDFEKSVFNQLKTDLMPDGNPFALNTTAKMNEISKADLPQLFETIFRGQVTWQDRHLLDDEQKKFWQAEVKRYRAHVKQALDAEKQQGVDLYNQMMNQFDNAAKEQEAIRKRERQTRQDVAKRIETRGKTQEALLRRRTELLTQIREATTALIDAKTGKRIQEPEAKAYLGQIQGYRDELAYINAKLGYGEKPKEGKGGPQKVSAEGKRSLKEKRTKPVVVRKKIPQEGQGGKKVVAYKIIESGPNKGRKVLKYSDGSTAYADETE